MKTLTKFKMILLKIKIIIFGKSELHYINGSETLPPPLSAEEERELLKLCKQNNDSAKEKLVLSNIRFIYSEAKKLNSQKVSIDDLVVAGIQGLLEAIPKFDMSSNNRFMTFASFWIRKELFDYIYQNSSQLKISTPKVTLAIK